MGMLEVFFEWYMKHKTVRCKKCGKTITYRKQSDVHWVEPVEGVQ